jgi:putative ABC transport system ATP-binding protein
MVEDNNTIISLQDVHKVYPLGKTEVHAVKGVTFDITKGDFISIAGPSGSGKSTILNMIGCIDTPTEGTVIINGTRTSGMSDNDITRLRHRTLGFIFQSFNLFPELSALENVMLPMRYAGVPFAKRRDRAAMLLEEVDLKHRMHHLPTMMSGGEQQRVAIARALANDPDLILADEPTGNLPSDKGEEIMEMLERFNAKGVTIVMVTHNPEQGQRAKRIIHLQDGMLTDPQPTAVEVPNA